MCGFCNVWLCVCVGFVVCGCFGNMCTSTYWVLYCLYWVFFALLGLCIFLFVFLYWCKDYCRRMTTQLQSVVVVVVVVAIHGCHKPRIQLQLLSVKAHVSSYNRSATT